MSLDLSAPEPGSPAPRPDADGTTPLWGSVMACCRVVVRTGFVGVALLGALVTPPAGMFLVAPLTGAGAGLAVLRLKRAFPTEPWARRGPLLAAATGAAFVPFLNGVALLGSVGGVVALVLLICGSCVAADWMMKFIEAPPAGALPRDECWMRTVVPSLPTAVLLQEWRATQQLCGSHTGAAERDRAARLRGFLLEELARRDPVAVERWLTSGDWSSEPQMRSDRDVAG